MTPSHRPDLADLLDRLHVVALPMRVRFRGITVREVALIDGPAGWGEFGAFVEYGPAEAAAWLASAIEAAYGDPPPARRDRIPINATVPAIAAGEVPAVLARFPGTRAAKVKVAEPGQTLADDVARVNAVRAAVPTVRVDANGGWSVEQAVEAVNALTADGPLEYVEQPCATVPELAELRRRVDVPIAADESIRKAEDPLHVVRSGAADIAVLKVAPLGGVVKLLDIAARSTSRSSSPAHWTRRSASGGGCWRPRRCRSCDTPAGWGPAACSSTTLPSRWCPSTASCRSARSDRTRPGWRRWPRRPTAGSGGSTAWRVATH